MDHYDPLAAEVKGHADEVFSALRQSCPVHHHTMPRSVIDKQSANYMVAEPTHEFWSVFGYDDCVQVLQATDQFSSREGPGPERMAALNADGMLLTADNPAHRRQRQIAGKAFLPRMVEPRKPLIRKTVDDLIDAVAPRGHADIMDDIATPLTIAMITDFYGVGQDRSADIARWGEATLAALGGDADEVVASVEAVGQLFTFLGENIQQRRTSLAAGERLPDDVLSALITSEYEGSHFTDEEILMASHLFFVGGYETTATAIGNAVSLMCSHPDQRAKLTADWSLLDGAVEEILRFASPVEGTFRTTTTPVTLREQQIPSGAKVRVVYASANRDDRHFEAADTFRIDRPATDLRSHIAFAVGPHACMGSALARTEIGVALETILKRLPDIELDSDRSPERNTSLTINGYLHLPVRWKPASVIPRLWD